MGKDHQYDWLVKLLIIGDSGVGKTNILLRACDDKFVPSHLMTIGVDFKIKTIQIDSKKIKMQIWDTAGQDRFKTITQTYYKGAMGIIMAYAVNDRNSFNHIDNWLKQIKDNAAENVQLMLVGNKHDCEDRVVDESEGRALAQSYGIPFIETSAKSAYNINECFQTIAKQIKDTILQNEKEEETQIQLKEKNIQLNDQLGSTSQQQNTSRCSC